MSLFVLVSPGDSPGVTTTVLALALAWPREVVLAESTSSTATASAPGPPATEPSRPSPPTCPQQS
jgi:hypothetical protein